MEILIDKVSDMIESLLTRIFKPVAFLLTSIIDSWFVIGPQLECELYLVK